MSLALACQTVSADTACSAAVAAEAPTWQSAVWVQTVVWVLYVLHDPVGGLRSAVQILVFSVRRMLWIARCAVLCCVCATSGVVRSTKMTRTIVVRRDYLHYIKKYARCAADALLCGRELGCV